LGKGGTDGSRERVKVNVEVNFQKNIGGPD